MHYSVPYVPYRAILQAEHVEHAAIHQARFCLMGSTGVLALQFLIIPGMIVAMIWLWSGLASHPLAVLAAPFSLLPAPCSRRGPVRPRPAPPLINSGYHPVALVRLVAFGLGQIVLLCLGTSHLLTFISPTPSSSSGCYCCCSPALCYVRLTRMEGCRCRFRCWVTATVSQSKRTRLPRPSGLHLVRRLPSSPRSSALPVSNLCRLFFSLLSSS